MHPMWIKICGMTDERAVAAALESRVDAIGFVFAKSVRRVEPELARRLAAPARGRVICVAVTQHPESALVQRILEDFAPDVLQTDAEDFAQLDAELQLPRTLGRMPVLRAGREHMGNDLPARLLIEGQVSGTGVAGDWQAARALVERFADRELVLAGGLNAVNVADAIRIVRPFGVDVSSGVEERPGVKSPARIGEFVHAARAA